MQPRKFSLILFLMTALGVVLLDRFTKYLITPAANEPLTVDTSVFQLSYHENRFAAFSLPLSGGILIGLIVLLILGFVFFSCRYLNWQEPLTGVLSAFVIGGALSNLADRILLGHVVDFIQIWLYPVFNLADTFIFLGVLILVVFYRRLTFKSNF